MSKRQLQHDEEAIAIDEQAIATQPAISAKSQKTRVYTVMLCTWVWTFLRVHKQVVMNMSMTRDQRGVQVSTTPPHLHTPTAPTPTPPHPHTPHTHSQRPARGQGKYHTPLQQTPYVLGFLFFGAGHMRGGGFRVLGLVLWLWRWECTWCARF